MKTMDLFLGHRADGAAVIGRRRVVRNQFFPIQRSEIIGYRITHLYRLHDLVITPDGSALATTGPTPSLIVSKQAGQSFQRSARILDESGRASCRERAGQ